MYTFTSESRVYFVWLSIVFENFQHPKSHALPPPYVHPRPLDGLCGGSSRSTLKQRHAQMQSMQSCAAASRLERYGRRFKGTKTFPALRRSNRRLIHILDIFDTATEKSDVLPSRLLLCAVFICRRCTCFVLPSNHWYFGLAANLISSYVRFR